MSRFRHLSVRARLIVLGAIGALVFVACSGIASIRFAQMSANTDKVQKAHEIETAVAGAYQQWLVDDDQSNMYAALVALRDPSQQQLAETTWGQVADAYKNATQFVGQARGLATTASERALLGRITSDLS